MDYSHKANDSASIKVRSQHNAALPVMVLNNLTMDSETGHRAINERIRRRLKELDVPQARLAEAIGMQTTTLSELLNLKKNRRWSVSQIMDVASFLRLPTSFLLEGNDDTVIPVESSLQLISVRGYVEAGAWREALEVPEGDRETIAIRARDVKLAGKYYALKIRGNSMNEVYPDGTTLVVCPIYDYPRDLVNGTHVIVQRRRGDLVEATAKELRIKGNKAELCPRSKDPAHKACVNIHWPYNNAQDSKIETVEITGVIVGAYQEIEQI